MKIIDFHCDTISKLMEDNAKSNLRVNHCSVDIAKMKAAGSVAQFFAMFVEKESVSSPLQACLTMVDRFYHEVEENQQDIALARNFDELQKNEENKKISAFLTVEEGGVLEGKIENLRILYRLGIRLITILWNYPNEIGYPNALEQCRSKGLTEFGREVVAEMNRLGMIVDVSHLSDQGFYDVAELSKRPFIASHSNARAVTCHPRNLTDDMIKMLAEKGGIIGVNFEKKFTGIADPGKLEDLISHVKHLKNVGGIEAVALGSDFDGISPGAAIKDISEMDRLLQGLESSGFTGNEIEKICYHNAVRIITCCCT